MQARSGLAVNCSLSRFRHRKREIERETERKGDEKNIQKCKNYRDQSESFGKRHREPFKKRLKSKIYLRQGCIELRG